MRILFLDTTPIRRGAQVFVADLANHLQEESYFVKRVYLYQHKGNGTLQTGPFDTVLDGNPNHFCEKIPSIHPVVLYRLVQTIRTFQPHIILCNGSRTLKYAAAAKCFVWDATFVYRIIDSANFWNTKTLKQWYYRNMVLPFFSGAVGVSRASLNDMVQLYHFTKPTTVIPRAINTHAFDATGNTLQCRETLGATPQSPIILFLGNLTAQKRPDRFLQIVKKIQLQIPEIQAWLVGDGPLRTETEEQAKNIGLQQNVRFWGYQTQVASFIAASNVLVLCSDTEGMPGVVLEAAYLGVPTVSANVGGIAECLDDGISGYIVTKDAIDLYVEKIIFLIKNEPVCHQLGQAAKKKVNNFTIDIVAQKYLDFFQQLRK